MKCGLIKCGNVEWSIVADESPFGRPISLTYVDINEKIKRKIEELIFIHTPFEIAINHGNNKRKNVLEIYGKYFHFAGIRKDTDD